MLAPWALPLIFQDTGLTLLCPGSHDPLSPTLRVWEALTQVTWPLGGHTWVGPSCPGH